MRPRPPLCTHRRAPASLTSYRHRTATHQPASRRRRCTVWRPSLHPPMQRPPHLSQLLASSTSLLPSPGSRPAHHLDVLSHDRLQRVCGGAPEAATVVDLRDSGLRCTQGVGACLEATTVLLSHNRELRALSPDIRLCRKLWHLDLQCTGVSSLVALRRHRCLGFLDLRSTAVTWEALYDATRHMTVVGLELLAGNAQLLAPFLAALQGAELAQADQDTPAPPPGTEAEAGTEALLELAGRAASSQYTLPRVARAVWQLYRYHAILLLGDVFALDGVYVSDAEQDAAWRYAALVAAGVLDSPIPHILLPAYAAASAAEGGGDAEGESFERLLANLREKRMLLLAAAGAKDATSDEVGPTHGVGSLSNSASEAALSFVPPLRPPPDPVKRSRAAMWLRLLSSQPTGGALQDQWRLRHTARAYAEHASVVASHLREVLPHSTRLGNRGAAAIPPHALDLATRMPLYHVAALLTLPTADLVSCLALTVAGVLAGLPRDLLTHALLSTLHVADSGGRAGARQEQASRSPAPLPPSKGLYGAGAPPAMPTKAHTAEAAASGALCLTSAPTSASKVAASGSRPREHSGELARALASLAQLQPAALAGLYQCLRGWALNSAEKEQSLLLMAEAAEGRAAQGGGAPGLQGGGSLQAHTPLTAPDAALPLEALPWRNTLVELMALEGGWHRLAPIPVPPDEATRNAAVELVRKYHGQLPPGIDEARLAPEQLEALLQQQDAVWAPLLRDSAPAPGQAAGDLTASPSPLVVALTRFTKTKPGRLPEGGLQPLLAAFPYTLPALPTGAHTLVLQHRRQGGQARLHSTQPAATVSQASRHNTAEVEDAAVDLAPAVRPPTRVGPPSPSRRAGESARATVTLAEGMHHPNSRSPYLSGSSLGSEGRASHMHLQLTSAAPNLPLLTRLGGSKAIASALAPTRSQWRSSAYAPVTLRSARLAPLSVTHPGPSGSTYGGGGASTLSSVPFSLDGTGVERGQPHLPHAPRHPAPLRQRARRQRRHGADSRPRLRPQAQMDVAGGLSGLLRSPLATGRPTATASSRSLLGTGGAQGGTTTATGLRIVPLPSAHGDTAATDATEAGSQAGGGPSESKASLGLLMTAIGRLKRRLRAGLFAVTHGAPTDAGPPPPPTPGQAHDAAIRLLRELPEDLSLDAGTLPLPVHVWEAVSAVCAPGAPPAALAHHGTHTPVMSAGTGQPPRKRSPGAAGKQQRTAPSPATDGAARVPAERSESGMGGWSAVQDSGTTLPLTSTARGGSGRGGGGNSWASTAPHAAGPMPPSPLAETGGTSAPDQGASSKASLDKAPPTLQDSPAAVAQSSPRPADTPSVPCTARGDPLPTPEDTQPEPAAAKDDDVVGGLADEVSVEGDDSESDGDVLPSLQHLQRLLTPGTQGRGAPDDGGQGDASTEPPSKAGAETRHGHFRDAALRVMLASPMPPSQVPPVMLTVLALSAVGSIARLPSAAPAVAYLLHSLHCADVFLDQLGRRMRGVGDASPSPRRGSDGSSRPATVPYILPAQDAAACLPTAGMSHQITRMLHPALVGVLHNAQLSSSQRQLCVQLAPLVCAAMTGVKARCVMLGAGSGPISSTATQPALEPMLHTLLESGVLPRDTAPSAPVHAVDEARLSLPVRERLCQLLGAEQARLQRRLADACGSSWEQHGVPLWCRGNEALAELTERLEGGWVPWDGAASTGAAADPTARLQQLVDCAVQVQRVPRAQRRPQRKAALPPEASSAQSAQDAYVAAHRMAALLKGAVGGESIPLRSRTYSTREALHASAAEARVQVDSIFAAPAFSLGSGASLPGEADLGEVPFMVTPHTAREARRQEDPNAALLAKAGVPEAAPSGGWFVVPGKGQFVVGGIGAPPSRPVPAPPSGGRRSGSTMGMVLRGDSARLWQAPEVDEADALPDAPQEAVCLADVVGLA